MAYALSAVPRAIGTGAIDLSRKELRRKPSVTGICGQINEHAQSVWIKHSVGQAQAWYSMYTHNGDWHLLATLLQIF
jgi:hypothetical protein